MSEPSCPSRTHLVSPRAARATIVTLWTVYFLVNTARAWAFDKVDQIDMVPRRFLVSVIGVGLTWLIYLVLRQMRDTRFRARAVAAFTLCVPLAIGYASVNYLAFYVISPTLETLKDIAQLPADKQNPALLILDSAIHWYTLFGAWAGIYLALVYAAETRAAEQRAAAYQAAAQAAELRALRYQVNPHFLFNTLNSLSTLIMVGRTEQAEQMILNLSTFFRTTLTSDPGADVPLAEEIRLQRLYLDIEEVRFPDRLRVRVDVPADLHEARVPALILQPLIENAIKYGVSRTRNPVRVTLRARRRGGELVLAVEDDAMCDDKLPPPSGHSASTGTGLKNVRDRLEARHGQRARVLAGPLQPCGYGAVLTMPLTLASAPPELVAVEHDA